MSDRLRAQRGQGLCESLVLRGPRAWESCRNRARYKRRNDAPTDLGLRVCGVHARAFVDGSMAAIGSEGWRDV